MKRSFSSLISASSSKRKKSASNGTVIDQSEDELTSKALKFFLEPSKNLFITHLRTPPIIFKHQLYSLKPDHRTMIDRQLQEMFDRQQIRFFHSDFGVMLMLTADYQLLVERQLTETNYSSLSLEKDRLKQRFLNDFLPQCIRQSVDRAQLKSQFQFNDNDIHLLIQAGLLLIKDINQYWISIPNLSPFFTCLKKARRTFLHILTRRTYRELPLDEFKQRDTKKSCQLGFDYHVHEILGANLAHLIDTPTGLVVRMGPEKQ